MQATRIFETGQKTKRRMKHAAVSMGLAVLLAGCSSTTTSLIPTSQTSEDPVLASIIQSFQHGCIENAPTFERSRVRAGFNANEPDLAQGMMFLGSGAPGRSCEVIVRRYGTNRPAPTVGDINRLARIFAANTGWAYTPAVAGKTSRATVSFGRRSFDVTGYTTRDGDLRLSVYD